MHMPMASGSESTRIEDTRSVKRRGFLREFPAVIVAFYRARPASWFVRSFVRSGSAFLCSPEVRYELSIIRDPGSLPEKSPSAAYVRSCLYEREESRDYAEMLLDNSRTYSYVDNELTCYRLNEKRNIQALSSESQINSSPPSPVPHCRLSPSVSLVCTFSHRLVVINGALSTRVWPWRRTAK